MTLRLSLLIVARPRQLWFLTMERASDLYVDGSGGGCGGQTPCYSTIQAAVNAAYGGDVIHVMAGIYQLANESPIRVSKGVTLTGDITHPEDTIIKAPGSGAFQGRACVFVLSHTSGTVTIEGFTIQDAPMLGGSNQNAGIWVGHTGDTQAYPVDNVVIAHNVIDHCANGIVMDANHNVTISHNAIKNSPRPVGTWTGIGIVAFNRGQWRTCSNLLIEGNTLSTTPGPESLSRTAIHRPRRGDLAALWTLPSGTTSRRWFGRTPFSATAET